METLRQPVICIVGPTASGKTAFSQLLARTVDAEIISADSMQIYCGMDIGTGKPALDERSVPHYGFDLCQPGEAFSVALFQDYARSCISRIDAAGKRPMIVGGTGFYLRAAIDDYHFPQGDQLNNPVRERYNAYALENGSDALWNLLQQRDPESAALIPPNDVKRVVRAFELLSSGVTYAQQKAKLQVLPAYLPSVQFGLKVSPEILAKRIDARVDAMLEEGWLEEVRTLLDAGFRDGLTAPQAIGYTELLEVLEGEQTLEQAAERIKTGTRRYAKRQRTWFRKDARITWIDADDLDFDRMLGQALPVLAAADERYRRERAQEG